MTCECGKPFRVKEELAGKRVKCPGCGKALLVPVPATGAAKAPPPPTTPGGAAKADRPKKTKPAAAAAPPVVTGTVIGVSALAMYAMMTVMTVLALAGLGMVISWLVTADASIWLLLVGLVFVLLGPAAIAGGVYRMRIKERLILGADRLQIVHRVRGEDRVITQVPYANVAAIRWEGGTQNNYVGIDLADLADADTYQKNDDFTAIKGVRGFHVIIDPGYTEPLATIYALLVERVKPFQEGAES
jgi:hypothetical protein